MKKILGKILQFLKFVRDEVIKFPAYILVHPLKGFEEFKRYGRGKISIGIAFVIITVILNILKFQYSGFVVNDISIRDLKSFAQVIYVVGAVIVVSVANWSVTTLFDGKGNLKYIFMMVCYCLYPYIWANLIGMILSNVLATEEVMIYRLIIGIGWFLTGYLFFFGIISIHEYGLGQCLLTIIFTLVAALIILFVGILVFDLFQKIYGFLYQIYQELTMRNLL
ncbi:MAG: YIP1 family protein [Bacilli bacterium]|nr:YIP1 family protein [Bacilli bacterium]